MSRFTQIAMAVIDDMTDVDGISQSGRRTFCYAAVDDDGRAWYCDFDGTERARWRQLPDHPDIEREIESGVTKIAGGSSEPEGGR